MVVRAFGDCSAHVGSVRVDDEVPRTACGYRTGRLGCIMDVYTIQSPLGSSRRSFALLVRMVAPGRGHRAERCMADILDWLCESDPRALTTGFITHDKQILGWAGYVKVDGTAYIFLGAPSGVDGTRKAVQKSVSVCSVFGIDFGSSALTPLAQFTSTQSQFVLTADKVDITVTFLSPIEVRVYGDSMSINSY